MNLIRIIGTPEVLSDLADIIHILIIESSGTMLPNGDCRLSAYTDEGITAVQARGATVEVLYDNAALDAQYAELDAILAAKEPNV